MKKIIITLAFLFVTNALLAQFFNDQERAIILAGDTTQALPVPSLHTPAGKQALRAYSSNISTEDSLLPILINRMFKTVQHPTHNGVGIAAPQIGINRNIIIVQRLDKKGYPFEYFINPIISWQSDLLQKGPEGDLSFDEKRDNIYRSYAITIQYQNLQGQYLSESIEGFTAVIFQHEVDHLHGVLLLDRHNEQQDREYMEIQTNLYQQRK